MISPTIHGNGTSGEALLTQQTDAVSALYDALEAMTAAAPNGRDYYPQGPEAFRLAAAEHAARIAKVRAVLAEYEAAAEVIADLIDGAER